MKDKYKELTDMEQKVKPLLEKSGFYLQTYRAIDAMNVLQKAQEIAEQNEVRWQMRATILQHMGQAYIQQEELEEGIACFKKAYNLLEDGNDKAATANMIADHYLREGKKELALEYADKALSTVMAPELLAGPYHIQGGVALLDGNYQKAIELMNKAAECAEKAHALTDLAMIIMDLSCIFSKMGNLETALSEIYRAERYIKESRNQDLYIRFAIRRAKILYRMGKDEEAKELIIALDELKNW